MDRMYHCRDAVCYIGGIVVCKEAEIQKDGYLQRLYSISIRRQYIVIKGEGIVIYRGFQGDKNGSRSPGRRETNRLLRQKERIGTYE